MERQLQVGKWCILLAAILWFMGSAVLADSVHGTVGADLVSDGINYKITKDAQNGQQGEVFVGINNLNTSKEITIPQTVTEGGNTYEVVGLSRGAFWNAKSLTAISLPDSIKTMEEIAFGGCSDLLEITVPEGVTRIEPTTFSDCTKLRRVTLGQKVEFIGDRAFNECDVLTDIVIPDSVKTIDTMAFFGCNKLDSVTLGQKVEFIGNRAFSECDVLTNIVIPDSVKTIDALAFLGCDKLDSITMGNNQITLGQEVFAETPAKKNILLLCADQNQEINKGLSEAFSEDTIYKGVMASKENKDLTVIRGGVLGLQNTIMDIYSKDGKVQSLPSDFQSSFGFTLTGNYKDSTYIQGDVLHVGADETAKSITAKMPDGATSIEIMVSTPPKPGAPTCTLTAGKEKITVKWKGISKASGYTIYRATSKTGTYSKVATLKSSSRQYTNTKLKKGKTYYYKMKSFTTVNGKNIYSSYGKIAAAKSK